MRGMKSNNHNLPASAKWGRAANAGFQLLPDILLKKQNELELSATDLIVLINITMHWWYEGQKPFPRSQTVATRMGIDPRTVQRSMRKMQNKGLLQRQKITNSVGEEQTVFDLGGLVSSLSKHAVNDPGYRDRLSDKELKNETPF